MACVTGMGAPHIYAYLESFNDAAGFCSAGTDNGSAVRHLLGEVYSRLLSASPGLHICQV